MKRYMLFVYLEYYPGGGMSDFYNSYDTIKEAADDIVNARNTGSFDLYHIYDTKRECIIKTNDKTIEYE